MERITKAPYKRPDRSDVTMETPIEAEYIRLIEGRPEPNLLSRVFHSLSKAKHMTKDLRSTIAGILRMVLVALIGWFFGDKIADAVGFSNIMVDAFFGVWAAVEAVVGALNNKGNKEPALAPKTVKIE